jgi:hypothetical protein
VQRRRMEDDAEERLLFRCSDRSERRVHPHVDCLLFQPLLLFTSSRSQYISLNYWCFFSVRRPLWAQQMNGTLCSSIHQSRFFSSRFLFRVFLIFFFGHLSVNRGCC